MNHQKIYESIIQKAKAENRIRLRKTNPNYVYYELHHIYPRCLGGTNDKENLILLTAREHFICHVLLTFIYYDNKGLRMALRRFQYSKKQNLYKISSKMYERIKIMISEIPVSKETRLKMSKSKKGKSGPWKNKHLSLKHKKNLSLNHSNVKKDCNPFFGKCHSIESKIKMRDKKLGKKQSEEAKQKRSESMKGKNKYIRTEEHKRNLSVSLTGRKLSETHKSNISKNSARRKIRKEL
jgi:hypothetical protein